MIPRLGRLPGEVNGYPLQYSGLENTMDSIVHGVTKELDTTEQLTLSHHLKILTDFFIQGTQHLHFVLGPTNYAIGPSSIL